MSIHQRIKERRLALGFSSHKALADAIGVSWQTVQLWEKDGGTAPNRNRIDRVAEVLQVTTKWLLLGEESPAEGKEERAITSAAPRTAPNPGLQFIGDDEYYLLSLFRGTDARGRADIITTAERKPKVMRPDIVRNKT